MLANHSKRSKKSNKFVHRTTGYYLSPRLKDVGEEIYTNTVRLKNEINFDALALESFIDLFPVVSDPLSQIDIIFVDAEEMAAHGNITPYQLITTIATIIETTNRRYCTKLCITVDSSTPVQLMRELQRMKGVYSLFGRSPEFSYTEIREQVKKVLMGRDPTPAKIKALINGKRPKLSIGTQLTPREIQIRDLVCKHGSSNKVIANSLGVSEATVKVHMGTILKKYKVKSRNELLLKVNSLTSNNSSDIYH